MVQIYSDTKYRKNLLKNLSKLYKIDQPKIQCFPKGIIAIQTGVGFGVFDRNHKFIKSSVQARKGEKGQIVPNINKQNIKYINQDVMFLCHTGRNHFGHFLLEQINRGWGLSEFKNIKIAIIDEKNQGKIPNYIYELLALLGVKKQNVMLVNKTTCFKNVYVPDPAFDLSCYTSDVFAQMFDKMSAKVRCRKAYDKIYVSRYALPDKIKTFGEDKVQKIFEKNGYKVIYPETLSIKEQISLIKKCKVLAGCAGTALHLALFMKKGGKVIQIKRNSILTDNAVAQYLINISKGLDSVFISGSVEKVKTKHSSGLPQIIGVTEYMKQFFDENGFKYRSSDLRMNNKEVRAYENILKTIPHKNSVVKWLQRKFIHFTSCLIIGRKARKEYRRFLRSRWG